MRHLPTRPLLLLALLSSAALAQPASPARPATSASSLGFEPQALYAAHGDEPSFGSEADTAVLRGLLHAFDQNRIAVDETPTKGYNLLRAEISRTEKTNYALTGLREVRYGIVGTNLLDDDVRNASSFRKDEVLLPGRSVRLFASAKF